MNDDCPLTAKGVTKRVLTDEVVALPTSGNSILPAQLVIYNLCNTALSASNILVPMTRNN